MCGLFGLSSTEGKTRFGKRKDMLAEGLYYSALRGLQSTGIAAIKKGEEKQSPFVYKRALVANDFIHMPSFVRVADNIDEYSVIIGHTRASTTGTVIDRNAHPFQFDHITLAHNGHIANYMALLAREDNCPIHVDSAVLTMAMAKYGEEKTLEKATGAFALTWHNSKDGTLNFARNDGRPLVFCYVQKENTIYWGSERLMLVSLLNRNEIDVEGKFKFVEPGTWLKFNTEDLRKYEKVPFVKRLEHTDAHNRSTRTRTTTKAPSSQGTDVPTTPTAGTAVGNNQEQIRRSDVVIRNTVNQLNVDTQEEAKRENMFRKSSGRPTIKKRIKTATSLLKGLGFEFEHLVMFDAISFFKYKNQKILGTVKGCIRHTSYSAEVANVSEKDYEEMKGHDEVLCKVINAKRTEDRKHVILILERDSRWPEFSQAMRTRRTLAAGTARTPTYAPLASVTSIRDILDSKRGKNREDSGPRRFFCGPGQTTINRERFLTLTRNGCGICDGVVGEVNDHQIIWINDSPICAECSANAPVLHANGIEVPKHLLS